MSTMITEVYDALTAAGAPDDKARAAATVLANADNRFDRIDFEIVSLKADVSVLKSDVSVLKTDVSKLKTDVGIMKWMMGFVLAFQIAIFVKLFLH
jgi:hypothetical protein